MEDPNHNGEIIEIKEVNRTPESSHIKIKIKERVGRGSGRHRFVFLRKAILILCACILGLYFGSRLIERYFLYWKKGQVEYYSTEDSSQLKPGAVFSPADY